MKPFLEPDLRNLPLLLGCFPKFSFQIILEPAPENLQNLRSRLTRGTYNEDAIEALLVFSIRICQGDLHGSLCISYALLLLRRPFYRLERRKLR